jgi:hypothetical protein
VKTWTLSPLTVVPASEAEIVCGLLRTQGITCFHRPTDLTSSKGAGGGFGGLREILVMERDLVDAR